MHNYRQFNEGLEHGDLARLVAKRITVDEYKSKIGDDEEIIVITFTVDGKEPAQDLVNFLEKSYDWIIDADASSGELDTGEYLVFIEADRHPSIVENILTMLADLENLTALGQQDWQIVYSKPHAVGTADAESLNSIIPTTIAKYRSVRRDLQLDIDRLKSKAGMEITSKAPVNDYTESLRRAAGIH